MVCDESPASPAHPLRQCAHQSIRARWRRPARAYPAVASTAPRRLRSHPCAIRPRCDRGHVVAESRQQRAGLQRHPAIEREDGDVRGLQQTRDPRLRQIAGDDYVRLDAVPQSVALQCRAQTHGLRTHHGVALASAREHDT